MHDSALIIELAESAHQQVAGNSGPEHLHSEHVLDDLLRFPVDVGVHQGHVVVAGDHVAQGGQTFFDTFYANGFGDGVTQVAQFHVRAGGRD